MYCALATCASNSSLVLDHCKGMKYSSLQQLASPLQELTCHMGSQCYLVPGRGDIIAYVHYKCMNHISHMSGRMFLLVPAHLGTLDKGR